jgi:hypothetical protein
MVVFEKMGGEERKGNTFRFRTMECHATDQKECENKPVHKAGRAEKGYSHRPKSTERIVFSETVGKHAGSEHVHEWYTRATCPKNLMAWVLRGHNIRSNTELYSVRVGTEIRPCRRE